MSLSIFKLVIIGLTLYEGLHLLYKHKRLLHKDISIGNLAYYKEKDGEIVPVILDFDLASTPESALHSASNHRTGTAPFMAREILDSNIRVFIHKIYHDLESLFYVLVWHALGYRGKRLPPAKEWDPLLAWRIGNAESMLKTKKTFMENEDALISCFRKGCSSLEDEVRQIWDEYQDQYRRSKEGSQRMDAGTKRKHAQAIKAEVLARTGDEVEAKEAYKAEYKRLSSDSTLLRGLGITFKQWMAAANADVEDEHAGCNCCF